MSEESINHFTVRDGFEWASVFLREIGQSVEICMNTSYGVYGHYWHNIGSEGAIDFLKNANAGYILSKFCTEKELDGERSEKLIREHVIDMRKHGYIKKDLARAVWDWLGEYAPWNSIADLHYALDQDEDVKDWLIYCQAGELFSYGPPAQAQQMMKSLWPKIIERICKEENHD